ncbi:MAG: glycoside hydrolase family 9 protein [Fibrobacteres bacterium]|nr:glycoside hydrolase family 9 protein [Fibrobacterota bacterium]
MLNTILCLALATQAKPIDLLMQGLQPGAYGYAYGGQTQGEIVKGDVPVLRYRGDNTEWSGWTFHLAKTLDLSTLRTKGGVEFEVKGKYGSEAVTLGLLDDDSDGPGKRVQIRAKLGGYTSVGTAWSKVAIPFSDLEDVGAWWDDKAKQEVTGKFDWSKLSEVRFLSDRGATSAAPGDSSRWIQLEVRNFRVVDSSTAGSASSAGAATDAPELRWNHVGYDVSGPKRFVAANVSEKEFTLLDAAGKEVYRGPLGAQALWEASGEKASTGDFSGWKTPGTYTLAVGKLRSRPFAIAANPFSTLLPAAVKGFYFQRASTELLAKHAGAYARPVAHIDTGLGLIEAGREGRWSATGGWYDAGDYGKYVVNAAYAVGVLLQAYQMQPKLFTDATNIPESGNSRPDLLDEVMWEMDWMSRMQDTDGGVFFKIATQSWDGMVAPRHANSPRFVIGKSTTSSLDYAACAAQSARLLKPFDKAFAAMLLERAEKAYFFARKNPALREPKNTGGSGPYEDPDPSDEFLWAATELWLATGNAKFRAEATKAFDTIPTMVAPSWQRVQNLAVYSLALSAEKDSLGRRARTRIDSIAKVIRVQIAENPYRAPATGFMWGSNDPILAKAVPLALAKRFDPASDASGLADILDYVLGRNATGYSFVTGTGEGSARAPHSRLMASDKVDDPMPGFVVGGPNWGREDSKAKVAWGVDYPYKVPARSYLDMHESYASNEIAINWNAVWVAALATVVAP